MLLYYSNRKLWTVLCVLSAALACVFAILGGALLKFWVAGLVCFSASGILCYWAIRCFSMPEKVFIELWEGQLKYYLPIQRKAILVTIAEIKHVQHLGHRLQFIMSDASVYALHLNYLSDEDIRRLLVFLKFTPSKARKLI